MAKKSRVYKKRKSNRKSNDNLAIAILALILNIFIPGLGSLIGRKTKKGIWQLSLFILGIPLSLIFIGAIMILVAWIWGIVTGIKLIQENI